MKVPARATLVSLFLALLLCNFASGGESPLPQASLGNQPLRSGISERPASGTAAAVPSTPSMDYVRVVGALGLVIALIVLLKWMGRMFFPSVAGRGSSRAVEVLSRSPLTPKQQVMLIRVGSKLIVVGDSGTQMNTLCEISDADEVASLIGQLRDEKSSAASAFRPLFGRFRKGFDSPGDDQQAESLVEEQPLSIDTAESELHGLRERVRQLAEQFK